MFPLCGDVWQKNPACLFQRTLSRSRFPRSQGCTRVLCSPGVRGEDEEEARDALARLKKTERKQGGGNLCRKKARNKKREEGLSDTRGRVTWVWGKKKKRRRRRKDDGEQDYADDAEWSFCGCGKREKKERTRRGGASAEHAGGGDGGHL